MEDMTGAVIDASTGWRLTVFAVHTALAGFLVWVSLPYGIFAYIGFLLAYGLDSRWRTVGFVATALVVSAAMAGGYPSGNAGQTVTYLVVAGVLVALTMNSASITNRVLEQNQERGQMIRINRVEAGHASNIEATGFAMHQGHRRQLCVTPLVRHAAPPAPLVDSVKPE